MTWPYPSEPPAAVLFDLDGTLADTADVLVDGLADTYEEFTGRRPSREEIARVIGMPLSEQLRLFGMPADDVELLGRARTFALDRFARHADRTRLFEPAARALALCRDHGLRTALVTSRSREELEDFHRRFPGVRADAEVGSSDVVRVKPDPESALLACQRLGVEPTRAIFVGDSIFDAQCARGAGMPFLAVGYGAGRRDELLAFAPMAYADRPEDLLALFTSLFEIIHAKQEVVTPAGADGGNPRSLGN